MSIQRWRFVPSSTETGSKGVSHDDGEWVTYDDHTAEVERLTAELEEARASDLAAQKVVEQAQYDALAKATAERDEALATKDAAYAERNRVVALAATMATRLGWRVGTRRTNIEGWEPAWQNCVFIELPTGQVSWHYHDSEASLFDGLPGYDAAWDGHTTDEKYTRLAALEADDGT